MNNPISILKDICEIAIKSHALIKKHFPDPIQKELLKAAAKSGEFYIFQLDQLVYPVIRAGSMDMGDQNSPTSLAKYYEAFKSLCEIGYIEHVEGVFFRLTASGLEKASNIK